MQNLRSIITLAALAIALFIGGLMGAWLQPGKPTAVAVVDWLAVTDELAELTARRAELEQIMETKNTERRQRSEKLSELRDELQMVPADSQQAQQLAEQLQMETAVYQAWWKATQGQLTRNELAMQIDTYEAIVRAVGEVAARDGWEIVIWDDSEGMAIDRTDMQGTVEAIARRQTLFAAEGVDITQDVIQYMNNDYRAQSGQ